MVFKIFRLHGAGASFHAFRARIVQFQADGSSAATHFAQRTCNDFPDNHDFIFV